MLRGLGRSPFAPKALGAGSRGSSGRSATASLYPGGRCVRDKAPRTHASCPATAITQK